MNSKAPWLYRLALVASVGLLVWGIQTLHRLLDRPASVDTVTRQLESDDQDLSAVWRLLLSDPFVAQDRIHSMIADRREPQEVAAVQELLPVTGKNWLAAAAELPNQASQSSELMRITAPRGLIPGPFVTIRTTGVREESVWLDIHRVDDSNDRPVLSIKGTVGQWARTTDELPQGDYQLQIMNLDRSTAYDRSVFTVATVEARNLWRERAALLSQCVREPEVRLFGQLILAMKGGFFGSADRLASQMPESTSRPYLSRLVFLHAFQGRHDAAEELRRRLQSR